MKVLAEHSDVLTLPVKICATHRPGIEPDVTSVTIGGREIWPSIREGDEFADARTTILAMLLDEDREQLREAHEAARAGA